MNSIYEPRNLAQELEDAKARIRYLEAELTSAKREAVQERLHAAAIKQDKEQEIAEMRNRINRLTDIAVPSGDDDSGFECPRCWTEIPNPYEDKYCSECGVKLDWSPEPPIYPYDNKREFDFDLALDGGCYV